MRGYSIWRPLMLIIVAFLTNSLVINLCVIFGMSREPASNVALAAAVVVALVMYIRMTKSRRK